MNFYILVLFFHLLTSLQILFLVDSAEVRSSVSRRKRGVKNPTVLTEEEKKVALVRHNEARSNVKPSSNNMLKMMWDEELARTAEEYSRNCIYEHSSGIRTSEFDEIGENLYITDPELDPKSFLEKGIKHWNDERFDYNFTANSCSDVCGHYTQVVWDDTYAVGCGMTTCTDITVRDDVWPLGQLLVCHYGPIGNANGRRPYRNGEPCRVCPQNYWCEYKLCNAARATMKSNFCSTLNVVALVVVILTLLA